MNRIAFWCAIPEYADIPWSQSAGRYSSGADARLTGVLVPDLIASIHAVATAVAT
jgi:hypothetical protein